MALFLWIACPAFARQESEPLVPTPPPVEVPQTTEFVPLSLPDPDPATDFENTPYRAWRNHSGPVETAVAYITVGATPDRSDKKGTKEFHVTGLVIRCDGFLLVPESVTNAVLDDAKVTLRPTGADGEPLGAELVLAGWQRGVKTRAHYRLIKVNNAHLKCAPLLHFRFVRPGLPVRVITAVPKKAGYPLCVTEEVEAVVGSAGENSGEFALLSADGKTTLHASPGSVVADKESGAPVGVVAQGSDDENQPSTFETFLHLQDTINEVGLIAEREVIAERKAKKPVDGMAYIPGGPVALRGDLRDTYRQLYKTDVACTPEFYIDTRLVTNSEYRAFLLSDNTRKQPPHWKLHDELRNPRLQANYPAVGMAPMDAMAYAAALNRRLPTPVERQVAARGAVWERGIKEMSYFAERYGEVFRAVIRYNNVRSSRAGFEAQLPGDTPAITAYLQREIAKCKAEEATLINTVSEAIHDFRSLAWEEIPTLTAPVAAREYDASAYHVWDVMMNAPELVLPRGQHKENAYKPLAARADVENSTVEMNFRGTDAWGTLLQLSAGKSAVFRIDREYPVWLGFLTTMSGERFLGGYLEQIEKSYVKGKLVGIRPILLRYRLNGRAESGFRCAR
jgi:hypothetical protein